MNYQVVRFANERDVLRPGKRIKKKQKQSNESLTNNATKNTVYPVYRQKMVIAITTPRASPKLTAQTKRRVCANRQIVCKVAYGAVRNIRMTVLPVRSWIFLLNFF